MLPLTLQPLPASYVATRESLHAVVEHVMSAAMHASIGKIGLRPHDGGFATQEFDGHIVAVEEGVLVAGMSMLPLDGANLLRAAQLVDIEPKAPPVYTATTALEAEKDLVVDGDSAIAIGAWFSFVNMALTDVTDEANDASALQIWPEHFDLACDFGDADAGKRANYGGSPGDTAYPEPYLYVGPWDIEAVKAKAPSFFTDSWGAALHYKDLLASDEPLAIAIEFFKASRDAVQS